MGGPSTRTICAVLGWSGVGIDAGQAGTSYRMPSRSRQAISIGSARIGDAVALASGSTAPATPAVMGIERSITISTEVLSGTRVSLLDGEEAAFMRTSIDPSGPTSKPGA